MFDLCFSLDCVSFFLLPLCALALKVIWSLEKKKKICGVPSVSILQNKLTVSIL